MLKRLNVLSLPDKGSHSRVFFFEKDRTITFRWFILVIKLIFFRVFVDDELIKYFLLDTFLDR
jgi:hypothetical protein